MSFREIINCSNVVVLSNLSFFPDLLSEYLDDTDDLHAWIEPNFGDLIVNPKRASRMIVVTSHLHLIIPKTSFPVKFYNVHRVIHSKFEGFVDNCPLNYPEPVILPGESSCYDLTLCKTAQEAYLKMLHTRINTRGNWKVALSPELLRSLQLNMSMCVKALKNYNLYNDVTKNYVFE